MGALVSDGGVGVGGVPPAVPVPPAAPGDAAPPRPPAQSAPSWGATFGLGLPSAAAARRRGSAGAATVAGDSSARSAAVAAASPLTSMSTAALISEVPAPTPLNSWFLGGGMPCFDRTALAAGNGGDAGAGADAAAWAAAALGATARAIDPSASFQRWVDAAVRSARPVAAAVRSALGDEVARADALTQRLLRELRRGMYSAAAAAALDGEPPAAPE